MSELDAPTDRVPTHWQGWHSAYDDPVSSQSRRLEVVRGQLESALDDSPRGPIRLLSLCAGDGRDVLGVLPAHSRGADVVATLVELDPGLAELARRHAESAGAAGVDVIEADAGRPANYVGERSEFDIVLCCGVFGNIADADIRATIVGLATMVQPGGFVLWTRHRREPDLTTQIRAWFEDAGFEDVAFVPITGTLAAVGRARLRTRNHSARRPGRLFSFVGDGSGALC
jgi:hypothetical protein